MKNCKKAVACLLCCSLLFFTIPTKVFSQVKIPIKLKPYIKTNKIPLGVKLPPKDSLKKSIDLSASAINFSLVTRVDDTKAQIKIEGVVKNIGRNDYKSGAQQQAVLLYEKIPGGATTLKVTKVFQNLAKGAEVKVGLVKNWDKSAEFPPTYILVISYDPDIYNDNNPDNNDINAINNKLEKSSVEINSMKC